MKYPDDLAELNETLECRLEQGLNPDDALEILTDEHAQRMEEAGFHVTEGIKDAMMAELTFASVWSANGRPLFKLTHSMAALLSVTRAPAFEFNRCPYPAFLIEVPRQYLPWKSSILGDTFVLGVLSVKAEDSCVEPCVTALIYKVDGPILPTAILLNDSFTGIDETLKVVQKDGTRLPLKFPNGDDYQALCVATRFILNTIAYITEHRTSVPRVSGPKAFCQTFEVRPPTGVTVDRAFRDLASTLVKQRDFKGARAALAHVVRGHWRNQPVGLKSADRKLTWIRPFRRGDQSMGEALQKTVLLTKPLS